MKKAVTGILAVIVVIIAGSLLVYNGSARSMEKCVSEFEKAVNTHDAKMISDLSITTSIDAEEVLERYSKYEDLKITIESEEKLNAVKAMTKIMTDSGLKKRPEYGISAECSFNYTDSETGEAATDQRTLWLLRVGNKYYMHF